MGKKCLTKLEVQRHMKANRSGGFPLILYVLMIWWGFCAVAFPVRAVLDAMEDGAEHPLAALFWEPLILALVAGGLSYLLFRLWRKLRRKNRPQDYRMAFGFCTEKEFTDMENRTWYTITAKTEDGAYGNVNVSSDTYETIGKDTALYVLINGENEIVMLWKADRYFLERDLLPMLSEADRMRESEKRSAAEAQPPAGELEMNWEEAAHARGELTADDTRRIRFSWLVIGILHLVFFLIGFFAKEAGLPVMGIFALGILFSNMIGSDSGAESAFIGRAYQKFRGEMGAADPDALETAILRKVRGRRLKIAAFSAAGTLPCLLLCLIGAAAHNEQFALGCVLTAVGYLLLGVRRAIEAFVKPLNNSEHEILYRLLRK